MKRLAIWLGLLLLAAGCDGHTSLRGDVVDPDDKPMRWAKLRLAELKEPSRGSDVTTDDYGRYSVSLTHAPFDIWLVVAVNKDGFRPYRKEFKVSQRESIPKKIVLEPEPTVPAHVKH